MHLCLTEECVASGLHWSGFSSGLTPRLRGTLPPPYRHNYPLPAPPPQTLAFCAQGLHGRTLMVQGSVPVASLRGGGGRSSSRNMGGSGGGGAGKKAPATESMQKSSLKLGHFWARQKISGTNVFPMTQHLKMTSLSVGDHFEGFGITPECGCLHQKKKQNRGQNATLGDPELPGPVLHFPTWFVVVSTLRTP